VRLALAALHGVVLGALAQPSPVEPPASPASTCLGTTSRGALRDGVQLPRAGDNFEAYSLAGHVAGRTYVHSAVRDVVLQAYASLQRARPGTLYVYGETGWREGGSFAPHRTHQNGLSVDFMVPVLDAQGRSRPLPCHLFNRYGYDVEFDRQGRVGELRIDAEAMAAHLVELQRAAQAHGVGIRVVIFDPALQPLLHRTSAWPALRRTLRFSPRPAWVRHDEHYHVDFVVPCQRLP
jgi:penicillin-insensitive murein endopeptidase